MKTLPPLVLAAALVAGCGGPDKYAENAVTPDFQTASEAPGDWSQLRGMIGRNPDESGLLQQSPISVDLNALLGPHANRFRTAMAGAGPLTAEGPALVTVARSRQAFLVVVPADHALQAGLRTPAGWRTFRTPGADFVLPQTAQALLRS